MHAKLSPTRRSEPCTCRPRLDNLPERLQYFDVRVGNTDAAKDPSANALCASYDTPYQAVYNLTCNTPLMGRFVSVKLRLGSPDTQPNSQRILTLCEVKVRQPGACASPTQLAA